MKLYKKDFCVYKDWLTLLPTIEIHFNNAIYVNKNIEVCFSWVIFHARLLFIRE